MVSYRLLLSESRAGHNTCDIAFKSHADADAAQWQASTATTWSKHIQVAGTTSPAAPIVTTMLARSRTIMMTSTKSLRQRTRGACFGRRRWHRSRSSECGPTNFVTARRSSTNDAGMHDATDAKRGNYVGLQDAGGGLWWFKIARFHAAVWRLPVGDFVSRATFAGRHTTTFPKWDEENNVVQHQQLTCKT